MKKIIALIVFTALSLNQCSDGTSEDGSVKSTGATGEAKKSADVSQCTAERAENAKKDLDKEKEKLEEAYSTRQQVAEMGITTNQILACSGELDQESYCTEGNSLYQELISIYGDLLEAGKVTNADVAVIKKRLGYHNSHCDIEVTEYCKGEDLEVDKGDVELAEQQLEAGKITNFDLLARKALLQDNLFCHNEIQLDQYCGDKVKILDEKLLKVKDLREKARKTNADVAAVILEREMLSFQCGTIIPGIDLSVLEETNDTESEIDGEASKELVILKYKDGFASGDRPDKKEDVKNLQKLLNKHGASLTIDGLYGDDTAQAVLDFQTAQGLSTEKEGKEVDQATLDALNLDPQ